MVDQINSNATSLLIFAQSGRSEKLCNTKGRCRVKPTNSIIGITICQPTSGDRTVIGFSLPAKIKPNTRVKLKAVSELTANKRPTNQGCVVHKPSANFNIAQKLPKGGRAINPALPT